MKQALLAALLFSAVALAPAFAQPHGATDPAAGGGMPAREPNLANPQDQQNQSAQSPIAHDVQQGPGAGSAESMPTPTLSKPMTPTH